MPGPRTPTKKIKTATAATIHPGASCDWPALGVDGFGERTAEKWSSWVRPNAPAAAGAAAIRMLVHPRGLKDPATHAAPKAARYGINVMRRRRVRPSGRSEPQKGRTATASNNSDK